jgi:hypothetical protein
MGAADRLVPSMTPLTENEIRGAFVNASLRERKAIVLPAEFEAIEWDRLDYLGWRDPKMPQLGYVVMVMGGAPTGVILRQSDGKPRARPQCAWCADVELPNDVVLYVAKKAGQAGRNGDTVGTLICLDFECNRNVRRLPPSAYLGFDREAARQRRIDALRENVAGFIAGVSS